MPTEDSWEPARQACLKQVFGGPLDPDETEQVGRFLATEEGREYLRQSEDMRIQLKEVVEVRPKPAAAAEMTRRFEAMIRDRAREALRAGRAALLAFGTLAALGLFLGLRGGSFTWRGWFMMASGALMLWVMRAMLQKNRDLLTDPNLSLSMRRDQALAGTLRTRVNGWIFLGVAFSGMALAWYLDTGREGLMEVLAYLAFGCAVSPLMIWVFRRKDRALWDWWEGKTA